jgi:hypothetical protein
MRKASQHRSSINTPGAGIAAGQGPVSPPERSRPQEIAFTLRTAGAFPMTHHVECVALLEKGR